MNPVQLEDGELVKSQNAIHDLESGTGGSLKNRRGLVKINSIAAAGSINGAIGVPITVGTAGNTGESFSPAIAPDVRTYLVARRITSTTSGWNTSVDLFTTSVTTGGPDDYDASADPRVPDYIWTGVEDDTTHHKYRALWSGRPGVMFDNRFYYAGNDYTAGTTSPTIRMFDGESDFLLGYVPPREGTVCLRGVMNMIVGGDEFIYFTTLDAGVYNANTMKVRVFQLDPETGEIRQVGEQFPLTPETVRVPFALAWHQGKLWTRTFGGGPTSVSHHVYSIIPDVITAWVIDETDAAGGTGVQSNFLISFKGQLYMMLPQDALSAALVRVRSSLGAYTTSHTVTTVQAGAPSMGTFGYANGFVSGAVFGGNLYLAYWNQEGAAGDNTGDKYLRIYKFDGTTWSVVYAPAANDPDNVPYNHAIVIGGRLFFVSSPARTNTNALNRIIYTANGTSFTAVTTTVLDHDSGGFMGAIAT